MMKTETRELIFRIWDKKKKKMSEPFTFQNINAIEIDGYHIPFIEIGNTYSDLVVLQYTGLISRNGMQIFEGDILQDEKGIGVVYYYPPQFIVQDTETAYQLAGGKVNLRQCEHTIKLGNIYENENLLIPTP